MPIKALMVDVDGVLIDGRPHDGQHWQASLEQDLGVTAGALHQHFFAPHWERIVLGQTELLGPLAAALEHIAPHLTPDRFLRYWFAQDARLNTPLVQELSRVRAHGIRVYLATNQEHLRAAYLMRDLGLASHVDGIFYSAALGARKPDPAFFARVGQATALHGEDLLLIDDSRQNIEAALQAGWQALAWTQATPPTLLRNWYP